MREIEFRGKRIDNNKWIYGDLEQIEYKSLLNTNEKAYMIKQNIVSVTVLEESIGQYTGLKDENGKKIFEGDIVKLDQDIAKIFCIESLISIVKYFDGTFICTNKDNNTDVCRSLIVLTNIDGILRGEVIGNIYDNPELIEERR